MRKFALPLMLTSLLATACTTGPAYEPPEPPSTAAGSFVTKVAGTDPRQDLPDDWWRLYRDPALDALIAEAFAANTDLRVASANLAKARAVADEARAGLLPSTSLTGGVNYGDAVQTGGAAGGTTSLGDADFTENGQFGVAWEVDLFGRIRSRIAAAKADAEAAEATRDAVRVLVAAETTRAYLDACAYAYSLDVARQSYDASMKNVELISALEKAGSVGKLDVERAGTAAARARAAIPPLEGSRQVALFELAALLGTTPDKVPDSARACAVPPEPVADIPIGDGAALLRRRPDLREAERRLAADTARIGVASADLYPTISLGGSGNFFRSDTVKGSDSFSFSLGPLLSWSFPNISVARARVRQAEAQGDASLARFDGTVVNALKEVEQALTRVATGERELEALDEAQTRAERAWQFADQRYRAGSVGYLDVLVALNDLLSARAAYAASLRQVDSARVDLFKALGGGWQAEEPALSAVTQQEAGN